MNKLILSTLAILMLTACLSQANVQWSRKIEGGKSANLIGVSKNGMYVLKNKGKKKYIDRYNINDFTFEKSSEIVFPMGLKKVSGITVEMLNDKIVMYYYSKEVKDRVSLWITTFNSFTLEQQPPLKITSKHVNPKPKNSLMMVNPYPYYPPIFNFRYSENQKKIVFWGWDCKHGYQRGFQKLSHIEVYTLDENLEKVNRQKFEIPENLYNIEESSCNNSDLLCFLTYKTLTKPVVQNNQGEKLQRAIQEKTLFSSVDKEDLETSLLIYDFAYAEYLEFDLGLKGKNISDLKITETKDEKIIVSGLYLGKNEKELCIFNSVFDKNLELKDGSENFVNPEYLSQNQNFRIHNILNKPSGGFSIIIEEAYDRVPCGNLVIINYNSAAELTGQSFISKRQRTIGPTNWNPRISSFLNNDKVEIYYHLNEVESDTVYYIRSTIDSDNEVTHNILFKYDIKSPTLVKFNSLRQHNNSDIYLVAKYNDIEMMGKIQYKN